MQDPALVSGAVGLLERYGAFGLLAILILAGGWFLVKILNRFLDQLIAKLEELRAATTDQAKATRELAEKLAEKDLEQLAEIRALRLSFDRNKAS